MSFKRYLLFALVLVLISGARANATVPAGMGAGTLPNVTVWDEANVQHKLFDELKAAGSGPVLVLPVYTRCTMSCPVLARMLVQQTSQLSGGSPYRVLVFSFDPGDDAAALRQFRAQKNLPASWLLVRSDAADIHRFLDFFHYTVLTEGPVMIHTNEMFLLNHNLKWRATFVDVDWNAAELHTWMQRAEAPGVLGWIAMNPDMLVYIAFGLLLAAFGVILWVFLRRPRPALPIPGATEAKAHG